MVQGVNVAPWPLVHHPEQQIGVRCEVGGDTDGGTSDEGGQREPELCVRFVSRTKIGLLPI